MTTSQSDKFIESWWSAVLVLLLAAWLGAMGLNTDAYGSDEVSSMIVAGGAHFGPFTPLQAWQRVAENSPDQAVGWALLLSIWGRVVGWSEPATRALPLFFGLLALAWVYRAGRDLLTPRAALVAILILGTSVLFVTYLHKLRVFTLATLAVTLTLRSYWRIMLHPKLPGWGARLGLLAGGIGLFYTHYFATPFLGSIGLYHLLFASKTRRWWQPVIIVLLAGLVFLPEINVLLAGLDKNLGNTDLQSSAMPATQIAQSLIFFFGNGQAILPIGLLIVMIVLIIRRSLAFNRNVAFLLFSAVSLCILMIIENEIVQVMTPTRVRYLMPLWPLLALLAGMGIAAIQWRRLAWAIVGLWVVAGLWANLGSDIRYRVDDLPVPAWREVRSELQGKGSARGDVFVFHGVPTRTREFYGAATIPMRREIIESWNTRDELNAFVRDVQRVWLGTDWRWYPGFPLDWTQEDNYQHFLTLLAAEFVHCYQAINDPLMRLDLYARNPAFCPQDAPLMRFGTGIALTGLDVIPLDSGGLELALGWTIDSSVLPDTWSVAVHVYDEATGALATQADFGLPPDPFAPVQIEIAADELPAGDYRVMMGIYNWQTGQRLTGEDQRTSVTGDLLPLYTSNAD